MSVASIPVGIFTDCVYSEGTKTVQDAAKEGYQTAIQNGAK